jgi:fibronectin-binding autotransporter adhesin
MARGSSRTIVAVLVCLGSLAVARVAAANNCTWKANSASTWTTTGSWQSCGGTYPQSGDTVQFSSTGTGNCTISGGPFTVSALSIAATYTGTITASASLTVSGATTITGGTLSAAALSGNGGVTVQGGTLNITGTSSTTTLSITSGTVTTSGSLTTSGATTLSGGTFTVSASATLNSFAISGGTFTGPTSPSTLTVTNALTMTGGTYTGGTGSASVGGSLSVNQSTATTGSDASLVGYWTMDDTSSPSVDTSGNGNNLTWTGTLARTTNVPTAITFTDSGSMYMAPTTTHSTYAQTSQTLANIPELRPTTVTVSAWYKATKVDSAGSEVVSGSNTYGLRLYSNSTTDRGFMLMKRYLDNGSTADWIEYRVPVSNVLDGNWHQLVGVITTGTNGAMTVYFDGVPASGGSYWVNGSNGATQLGAGTSPTSTAAAAAAIMWDANTETFGLVIGDNPSTNNYQFGKGCSSTSKDCAIDDVRVYNRALTDAQIAALAAGSLPSGGGGVMTLAGTMSVTGSVNVQSLGTLTLSNSSAVLKVGSGSTLIVDGTLNSTSGTIQSISGNYTFQVGSSSSATPVLNVNGLTVKNTDKHGMMINGTPGTTDSSSGSTTTISQFDKVAFSSAASGAAQLLNVFASTLYLTSNGCTFDGSATKAITLTSTAASGATGPRLIFGNATCAVNDATTGLCATSQKTDDDSGNGVPSPTNGGIVSFIRSAQDDTAGTRVGFPTAAFDWSTFTYYSTYVTFHGAASSGADTVYVRDGSGNPLYSWTDPTVTETIVGTPQWTTSGGTHYVYVAANGVAADTGMVYRLKDTGTGTTSGTLTLDTTWNASGGATSGIYSCGCTFTSNISLDASNVYWSATIASASKLMGILQSNGKSISTTTWPVSAPAGITVTSSPPQLFTKSGTTTLYMGATADMLSLAVTGTTWVQNTGVGTINGRVSVGTSGSGTTRVYAGNSSGTVYALNSSTLATLWSYSAGAAVTDTYFDFSTDTVQFGTSAGNVIALTAAGSGTSGVKVNTTYPYALTGSVTTAPLYYAGVLAVATSQGNLYFLDRNTGLSSPNGVSIIKMYNFGTSESVSTIGFDSFTSRYMVSTSSSAQDGRLYYFDQVSDPTPSYQ